VTEETSVVDEAKPAAGKPSPRRKSRDGGVTKPADYQAAEAAVAEAEAEAYPSASSSGDRRKLTGALFGVAVVLIGLAVWFKIEDSEVSAATSNAALLDVARTSEAKQAATGAVETLFSYDFTNVAKTQDAAKDLLLTDDVRNKYTSLMSEVQRLAPQQKIVVTVKASRSAVIMLDDERARVMVFVDQTATRTDQNQTSSGSAQLWLQLQRSGDKWKVVDLDTYNTGQPSTPAQPAPSPSK
jgi:Mce-associated membrane protein